MIPDTMTVWFVAAVPVLIMFFALAMERLENRLRHLTVQENEVEEFLQAARPEEVRVLFGSGISRALELFQRRRLPDTSPAGASSPGASPAGASAQDVYHGAALRNGAGAPRSALLTSRHSRQRP